MVNNSSLSAAEAAAQLKRDYCFKVVVLGDCFVGKTSIIQNYISQQVSMKYKTTMGADMH